MEELEFARRHLEAANCTCVLWDGTRLLTSRERGVKPLVLWLHQGLDAKGFVAADKVVGKGAAFLYWKLGVRGVFAQVMSRSAGAVLERAGISCRCDQWVDGIWNRSRTGPCPMESAVRDIDDLSEALEAIFRRYNEMNPQEAILWK